MYVFLLLSLSQVFAKEVVNGQQDSSKWLHTIQVQGIKYPGFYTGYKFLNLDSNVLLQHAQSTLSEVLAQQSTVFIKSYGPGMLATPGFRGGNANHTAVLWNGFNLQSPMNGQTDLALLPAFLLESVVVQYGSQAVMFGSGSIGGAIHVQTDMHHKTNGTAVMTGIGSFGNFSAAVKSIEHIKKLSIAQKVFYNQSINNFSFYKQNMLLPNSVQTGNAATLSRMSNAQLKTIAWLQEYQYQINTFQSVSLRTWIQQNNRQIPAALFTPDAQAMQTDQSAKILGEYRLKKSVYELQARYGFLLDNLRYDDQFNGPSESNSYNHLFYLDYFKNVSNSKWQVSGMGQSVWAHLTQSKTATHTQVQQTRLAIFSSYQWNGFDGKLIIQSSARQEWVDGKSIPFTPAFGFTWQIHKYLAVFGNVARSYRLPTFNDLYWPLMGNKNLQAEHGWNEELSAQLKKAHWRFTITAYNKNIHNWIVWLPNGGGLSTPMNVYKVWSRGIEFTWENTFRLGQLIIRLNGLHERSRTTNEASLLVNDASVGKQLIYTPRLQHRLGAGIQYKQSSLQMQYSYTGLRFVSSDELNWLAPYHLVGFGLNQKMTLAKKQVSLQLQCNNILNNSYQVMVNRPMPLFTYQLTLQIQL